VLLLPSLLLLGRGQLRAQLEVHLLGRLEVFLEHIGLGLGLFHGRLGDLERPLLGLERVFPLLQSVLEVLNVLVLVLDCAPSARHASAAESPAMLRAHERTSASGSASGKPKSVFWEAEALVC
jgi:hypothetical protein